MRTHFEKGFSVAVQDFTIVTGASAGIGLEMAKILASEGRSLVLVARREEVLKQLAAEWQTKFGIEVKVIGADLTKEPEVERVLAAVQDLPLRGLINNAGFGDLGEFAKGSWTTYAQMIALNVSALVQLTHGVLPQLIARKSGQIVNVASTAAFQPGPYFNVYSASKAFVLSFSEALAEELRGSGVTVTVLCPGMTKSEFHARAGTEKAGKIINSVMASAVDVAAYGLKAMKQGSVVAIPGLSNRAVAFTSRHFPKAMVTRVVAKVLRPQPEN